MSNIPTLVNEEFEYVIDHDRLNPIGIANF
jgi:hypothetical protein